MERLRCRLVKNKEVTDLKHSSKKCGNTYNISVDSNDVANSVIKVIFAVVIGYRLLTVPDSVIQSILENVLEAVFSGIEMLH